LPHTAGERPLDILAGGFRAYAVAVKLSFRSFTYFWLDYLAGLLGYALAELSSMALILAAVLAFHAIDGWTLRPLLVLLGLSTLVRGIRATFTPSILTVPELIQSGSFDALLIRPVHPLVQALNQPGSYTVGPASLVAAPAAVLAFQFAGIAWSLRSLALILTTVVGGVLMLLAVDIAVASQSLWTGQAVEPGQMQWTLLYIQGAYSQYPLAVFPKLVRWALTYLLPFAFISFFPARVLGPHIPGYPAPLWYAWLTLPIGVAMVSVAAWIWNRGMHYYRGTGS